MRNWRTSMVLLGISVLAMVIGFLRLATEPTPLPPGSSYSGQADGSLALYSWLASIGSTPTRLSEPSASDHPGSVLVIQPATAFDQDSRRVLDEVADRGGTLVVAGDSLQWLALTRALGVTAEPVTPASSATTPDGLTIPFHGRFRLRAEGAEPLLLRADGTWGALRKPYRQGSLVVLGSAEPLSNAGLSDPDTARFVFRTVISPLQGQVIAFDEIARPSGGGSAASPTLSELLLHTPAGLTLLYVALLVFGYLLLSGKRLGPALSAPSAAESQRTMYEHVQMLADLYRRAGQLSVVRGAFSRHYARRHPEAVPRIAAASSETDLIDAVSSASLSSEEPPLGHFSTSRARPRDLTVR